MSGKRVPPGLPGGIYFPNAKGLADVPRSSSRWPVVFEPLSVQLESEEELFKNEYKRHQMFGVEASVLYAPQERGELVLLAQFDTDDDMRWLWGDCDCLQYWIHPDDLKLGNWDAVVMMWSNK